MFCNVYVSNITGKPFMGFSFESRAAARKFRDHGKVCLGIAQLKEAALNG